jgi:hypothetical protein
MVIPYMPMLIPPICWTGSVFVAYFLHWLSYDASYKLDSTYGLELWLFFWYYYLHNIIDGSNWKDSLLYISSVSGPCLC